MMNLLLRLKRFCGFIFGFVFFFSGIIKLMDPIGAGLVMKSYFEFMHLGFLVPAAGFFGTAFALAETLLGAALVCGVWRKQSGMVAIVMQSFFTLITLILLIFNPEMDCGCFGEAIHLTHLQTFIKNLILLALILTYYIPSRHLGETTRRKYVSFGIVCVSSIAFMIYSLLYIPLMDFTAYRPGAELLAAASKGGDDIYEAVFTYEKDGLQKDFVLNELPDSTWTFVSTKTLSKTGADDTSIELSIFDAKSQSYADTLAAGGKVLVISIYDPEINNHRWEEVEAIAQEAQIHGIRPLILTTELNNIPQSLIDLAYTCDYKTLISLNRSNGGITYFNNGILIKKWSRRTAPDTDEIQKIASGDSTETAIDYESKGSLGFQGFLLYVCAVLLLL